MSHLGEDGSKAFLDLSLTWKNGKKFPHFILDTDSISLGIVTMGSLNKRTNNSPKFGTF